MGDTVINGVVPVRKKVNIVEVDYKKEYEDVPDSILYKPLEETIDSPINVYPAPYDGYFVFGGTSNGDETIQIDWWRSILSVNVEIDASDDRKSSVIFVFEPIESHGNVIPQQTAVAVPFNTSTSFHFLAFRSIDILNIDPASTSRYDKLLYDELKPVAGCTRLAQTVRATIYGWSENGEETVYEERTFTSSYYNGTASPTVLGYLSLYRGIDYEDVQHKLINLSVDF